MVDEAASRVESVDRRRGVIAASVQRRLCRGRSVKVSSPAEPEIMQRCRVRTTIRQFLGDGRHSLLKKVTIVYMRDVQSFLW